MLGKLQAQTAAEANRVLLPFLARHPGRIRTIMADDGTEFHRYGQVEARSPVKFYFATPRQSWERGTNENTNGLIWQYLPKGLGVGSPPVDQPTNDQTADAAENKNGNILLGDDGVGKADQQTEQEADHPTGPARELDAANDESNRKATAKSAEQRRRLVRERHRQHEDDIQPSEDYAGDQTKNDFRHAESSSASSARSQHLTR